MSNNAVNRPSGGAASRLKAVVRRAEDYHRNARRALTLALVAAGTAVTPSLASAQMGQTAMAPTGGVVNRAVNGFQSLNANGPGWLYYGINAADRGLGYRGSYMTLGGFIPMAEDDLGGFWAADLRGHLSEYGGFFSNVGAVRKQFIGGTLLGVGVYWDYDGDQNQYSDTVIPVGLGNTYTFAGGHSYNQVGISGEWLTDWGNLRSNGYIPVGSTAQLVGPFLGNSLLCVNGINAALGGTDLEVGAYIPGLSDWAGMISVGGYALGNTRYSFPDGAAAVPWFGGVYTRLDMTFIKNWDFSLQANNDSYFDWTGFARLTYRMGGSRRRNVPDQMEQPMMRNEHIVRAHQVPEVATNPADGSPWRVFHVDNTAEPGGTGSAESPFATIEEAVTRPTNDPYDIVYVHVGDSSASAPYITPVGGFTFGADNQYLIGEGSRITIPTESCGDRAFFAGSASSVYPFISNPVGSAIVIDRPGTQVNHIGIVGSQIGISDGTGIAKPDTATIQDVTITGADGAGQRGILIANSTGTFTFDNIRLSNLSNDGLVLAAPDGHVKLSNSSLTGIQSTAIRVSGSSARAEVSTTAITKTNGTAVAATGPASLITLTSGTIVDTNGDAVVASGNSATVQVVNSKIANTSGAALSTTGNAAVIAATATTITNSGSTGAGIRLDGIGSRITLASTRVDSVGGAGVVLAAADSVFHMSAGSQIRNTGGDGISIENSDAFAIVSGRSLISRTGGNGVTSLGGRFQIVNSTIERSAGAGIQATNVFGTTASGSARAIWVQGATISNATDGGILVEDSDLRVEKADPSVLSSKKTSIANTGIYGIRALATSAPQPFNVLVDETQISGVDVGILAAANGGSGVPPIPTINFTATDNVINTNADGVGINLSAAWNDAPANTGTTLSRVNAVMTGNSISTSGDDDILLTSVGGPLQYPAPGGGVIIVNPASFRPIAIRAGSGTNLENLNNGANVVSEPEALTSDININYDPGLLLNPPAPPPAPTVP